MDLRPPEGYRGQKRVTVVLLIVFVMSLAIIASHDRAQAQVAKVTFTGQVKVNGVPTNGVQVDVYYQANRLYIVPRVTVYTSMINGVPGSYKVVLNYTPLYYGSVSATYKGVSNSSGTLTPAGGGTSTNNFNFYVLPPPPTPIASSPTPTPVPPIYWSITVTTKSGPIAYAVNDGQVLLIDRTSGAVVKAVDIPGLWKGDPEKYQSFSKPDKLMLSKDGKRLYIVVDDWLGNAGASPEYGDYKFFDYGYHIAVMDTSTFAFTSYSPQGYGVEVRTRDNSGQVCLAQSPDSSELYLTWDGGTYWEPHWMFLVCDPNTGAVKSFASVPGYPRTISSCPNQNLVVLNFLSDAVEVNHMRSSWVWIYNGDTDMVTLVPMKQWCDDAVFSTDGSTIYVYQTNFEAGEYQFGGMNPATGDVTYRDSGGLKEIRMMALSDGNLLVFGYKPDGYYICYYQPISGQFGTMVPFGYDNAIGMSPQNGHCVVDFYTRVIGYSLDQNTYSDLWFSPYGAYDVVESDNTIDISPSPSPTAGPTAAPTATVIPHLSFTPRLVPIAGINESMFVNSGQNTSNIYLPNLSRRVTMPLPVASSTGASVSPGNGSVFHGSLGAYNLLIQQAANATPSAGPTPGPAVTQQPAASKGKSPASGLLIIIVCVLLAGYMIRWRSGR